MQESQPNSYQIDKPEEIDKALLSHAHSIGICGATSTPKWLMEACKKSYNGTNNKEENQLQYKFIFVLLLHKNQTNN